MSATQDFVALDWIKGEIASTLDQAQQALEAVAESPDDSSSMRACLTHLHQINGTLRMVNLEGPSQLSAEMEKLAESLMGNEVPDVSRAQEVLMQAILQMPRYLDRIQREQLDEPGMVRGVVNSLRVARGESSLGTGDGSETEATEGDRLSPLTQPPTPEAMQNYQSEKGFETAKKLRARYQQALSALLKKQQPRENLTLLGKVFTMLLRICGDSPIGNLSLLGLATVDGVAAGAIKLNSPIANNLKAFDAELKKLVEGGDGLEAGVDPELGEQLLAAIDGATKETQRMSAAKARFAPIASLVPEDEESVSFGPDDETLAAVSRILIEELAGITDNLDLYVRSADRRTESLTDLAPQLEQINGTLSVVGLTQHMDSIASQVKTIRELQESGDDPSEDVLLDIARSLLEIESSLKSFVGDEDEGEGEGFGSVGTAEATVIKETRNGLSGCKDAIIEYVSADFDGSKVEELPRNLLSLKGGLQIINQMRSAEVLDACAAYVRARMLAGAEKPTLDDMNDLADAITSIDYYLERYLESPGDPYLQMVEVAEEAITKLGFEPGNLPTEEELAATPTRAEEPEVEAEPETVEAADEAVPEETATEEAAPEETAEEEAAPEETAEEASDAVPAPTEDYDAAAEEEKAAEAEAAAEDLAEELEAIKESLDDAEPASDDAVTIGPAIEPAVSAEAPAEEVDDEILEIFIEEAGEVIETVNEYFPRWQNNTDDADALTEVRRAFHTLKGSGRMVGATVVGELAWSIENMLNRVIDRTIDTTPQLLALVGEVIDRLPEGIDAFRNGNQSAFECSDLAARADTLAAGGEVDAAVPEDVEAPEESAAQTVEDKPAEAPADDVELDEISLEEESTGTMVPDESVELDEIPEAPDTGEVDTELDDIFRAEADERLTVIREFLASPTSVTPDLVAAFHTLKGSAGMAEIHTVSRIGASMESLARRLYERSDISDEFIELVSRSASLIATILGELDLYRAECPDADVLVAAIDQVHTETDESAPPPFDFHNIRLLSTADSVVEAWDTSEVSSLTEELREVIRQAEAIEQPGLETLSVSLLGVYERLESRPSQAVAQELAGAHELLVTMFDAIASGQAVPEPADVPARLDELDVAAELATAPEEPEEQPADAHPAPVVTGARVELPADEIDEDVLPLFLEEAEEIVEEVDQSIVEWSSDPSATEHLDNLLRQLHTLKGGARMSGLASLGECAHNFETFLIGVQQQDPATFDEAFFALVNERQDEINRRVEIYRGVAAGTASAEEVESMRYDTPPSPGAAPARPEPADAEAGTSEPAPLSEDAVTAVTEDQLAGDEMAPAAATSVRMEPTTEETALPEDDIDDDVLPIFLEEAEEIVEGIDQSILDWSNAPESNEYLDNLLRQLHTLKGGSRMAGLASLGEFTHNLETWLIGVQQNPPALDDDFFALINQQQDEINRRVGIYRKLAAGEATDEELASMQTAAQPGAVAAAKQPAADGEPIAAAEAEAPAEAEEKKSQPAQQQEMVRVASDLLEELISLAGESSITRGRIEQQIADFGESLEEMEDTINRIREQVRRLEIEAESRETVFRTRARDASDSGFDDLEMDRYTMIQEISRALSEGMSDMLDLRDTLVDKSRDAETLLHQQARIGSELQEGLTRTRMVPFARLIPRLRRIVRQISAEIGKSVRFDAYNVEGELDRTVLERIVAPLEHMLRNAVDHGIESAEKRKEAGKPDQGRISLRLDREGGYVVLKISDDGGGINVEAVKSKAIERGLMTVDQQLSDHEIRQFILHAGFSTAQKLTQISGRGVGMDVVVSEIKALGGDVEIDSTYGVGTEFTIRLPFTVSINRALMVVIQDEVFAIPLNTIEGIVRVSPYELEAYYQPDAPMFEYAGQPYRLSYMGKLLDKVGDPVLEGQISPLPVILARSGDHAVALQVDRVIGSREVVVKSLGPQFSEVGGVSGATVLGDGSVVIILDVMSLVRTAELVAAEPAAPEEEATPPVVPESGVKTVMIVDDSVTVRKVTSRLMERQGWEVTTAKDGLDAMNQLQETLPDIVLLDIEMPRMDGFEVLGAVRRDERLKDLPIIMITSRTGEKHQQRAFDLGVNRYLGKPFQEAHLITTIGEVLAETKA